MAYTVGSLFSGVGGLDLAAHWAGFTTSWFVEREPFCQKILAKHWPDVPCHSDVFEAHDLPHVDIVIGGFPCQPFSVAGNRKGADDERYLLPEMLRIIREVKPYVVLFENVPGFPSLSDGAEFKYLLRSLAEMGFNAEWGHLRASDSGAPHQRERWFLVAYASSRGHNGRGERIPGIEIYGRNSTSIGGANSTQVEGYCKNQLVNAESIRINDSGRIDERQQIKARITSTGKRLIRKSIRRSTMGNTTSAGLERANGRKPTFRQRSRPGARAIESRLRGTLDGLPRWMDFVGWPARPGEDQHAYEPSRVTSAKTPDRAARLKALGNAVVPQVAFPLFVAIHEWLTAQDAERVA